MTKEEFCEAADIESINQDDYRLIEQVYAHHPSISARNGKREIAAIYKLYGGLRIIRDMLPTALRARDIEDQLMAARSRVSDLQEQLRSI